MRDIGVPGLIIILINIAFSHRGFVNQAFFDGYKFEVDRVLAGKDYLRLISSGFLHVSWMHLIFNMLSLYAFCGLIEIMEGEIRFLVIYFVSLIGGNLLSLFINRNHGDYSAVGASGAIAGIIFASIALYPGMGVGFFGLPFSIPGWLYGIIYVLFSIYAVRSKKDNIGHEAHLGGALIGMIVALLMHPSAFTENYVTILLILIPTVSFIYFIIKQPSILLIDNLFYKTHDHYRIDHKYNQEKHKKQQAIDRILDKINRKGMNSLSNRERRILKSGN